MAAPRSFQNLIVYKKAFGAAIDVHKATLNFPKIEQYALADQMRRASKSICANIAEGYAKQNHSPKEFERFLSMAQGSSNEMLVWVSFCQALKYIDNAKADSWLDSFDHISKMINKLRSASKKRKSE